MNIYLLPSKSIVSCVKKNEGSVKLKIAILGAAGRMGKWLLQYFTNQGHSLTVSDVRREEMEILAKTWGAKLVENNREAVKNNELIVVSVPIDKTANVLYEIYPYLKENMIIAEISSIKLKTTVNHIL